MSAVMSSRRRRAPLRDRHAPRFALFGETLLVGILVLVASLPVVTAVPALAAGVRHLRRHATGESDRMRVFAADFVVALRRLWLLGLAAAAMAALLILDAWALAALEIPGASPVSAVVALAAAAGAVVVLRAVGGWHPSSDVRTQLSRAAREAVADPIGSLLLLLAIAAAVVLVWMFPAFVLLVGGLLCLAAYGVDARLDALVAE